mmetsp:Transcript_100402/g.289973  ORF Transcript_100402/g.289973 Transcript_100402/m.289973 type:complete len:287 (-) Transcript_100402:616-1476(-)
MMGGSRSTGTRRSKVHEFVPPGTTGHGWWNISCFNESTGRRGTPSYWIVNWATESDIRITIAPSAVSAVPVAMAARRIPRQCTLFWMCGSVCCANCEAFGRRRRAALGDWPRSGSCCAGAPGGWGTSMRDVSPADGFRLKLMRRGPEPGWSKAKDEASRLLCDRIICLAASSPMVISTSSGQIARPGSLAADLAGAVFGDRADALAEALADAGGPSSTLTRSRASPRRSGKNSRMRRALKESTMIARAGTASKPIQNNGSCIISTSTLYIHGDNHSDLQYTARKRI